LSSHSILDLLRPNTPRLEAKVGGQEIWKQKYNKSHLGESIKEVVLNNHHHVAFS
jgi:hypothetical protein